MTAGDGQSSEIGRSREITPYLEARAEFRDLNI
jgi:hypothetical protein